MRNIYDIIAEQKAMVDVNIAAYDLHYTNKFFMNNQDTYYMQEGFGESVKKGAKKVVEFIKKIIAKIKELVNKVIGFFKKSNDEVEDMEKQIIAATNAVGSSGAAKVAADGAVNAAKAAAGDKEEAKEEKKEGPKAPKIDKAKEEKKEGPKAPKIDKAKEKKAVKTPQGPSTKVSGLLDVLEMSSLTVQGYTYQPLERYVDTTNSIFNSIDARIVEAIEDGSHVSVFDPYVTKDVFGKNAAMMFKDAIKNYYTNNVWSKDPSKSGESKKEIIVRWQAKTIYEYARNGAKAVKHFKQMEKGATDSLNRLIKSVTSNPDSERAEALVTKAANMISLAVNYFSQTVTRATSQYIAICRKVTNDYCNSRKK